MTSTRGVGCLLRRCVGIALVAASWLVAGQPLRDAELTSAAQFDAEVAWRLDVPLPAREQYIELLQATLADSGMAMHERQHVVLVDRSPNVQALAVLLFDPPTQWVWLGASVVSTGKPGQFDHFVTPLGLFEHSLSNPDFRAEGTFNENHIRGYGRQGMRVFDFGWVMAERGWDGGGLSTMRLQMHATDPDVLEPRLGTTQSKGCIRIPASLNRYLDHRGILDADYEQAAARGQSPWVLRADRAPTAWPGRYLVIVDSRTEQRPAWSPLKGPIRPPLKSTVAWQGPGPC